MDNACINVSVGRVVTWWHELFSCEFLSETRDICSAYISEVIKGIEQRKNLKNLERLIFAQTDKLLKMRFRHLVILVQATDILCSDSQTDYIVEL